MRLRLLDALTFGEHAAIVCGAGPAEEDMKLLQRGGLGAREALAARLRLAEKRILQSTMDAVRRCAAFQLIVLGF